MYATPCPLTVLLLTIVPPLVSCLPGPPSSNQHLATFLALHHELGSPDSVEAFPFMVVALQTGQPVFQVPEATYGLGQVPLLFFPAPSASHPWVKSEGANSCCPE